jgi:NAD(P)-dependent dehydrogenase (short-subunit alcohol dehydrogenase family)
MPSRAVLITGCSSGIGRATARLLASQGWTVYATVRRTEGLDDLTQAGCRLMRLDLTEEPSMEAAVRTIEEEQGAVGVLINNAGYSQSGAVERVPIDLVRKQLETNVIGPARLIQLVLPRMREQRWGRIVNVSSMGGRLVFPGGGYYHATKYALEALSDALRFEVQGFGIEVIVIEPGLIRTAFGETGAATVSTDPADPYAAFHQDVARSTRDVYERGFLARLGGAPEDVAEVIARALSAEHPKTRYMVTPSARLLITLRRWLPDRWWDRLVKSSFRQPA